MAKKKNERRYRLRDEHLSRLMSREFAASRDDEKLLFPGRDCGTCSVCCHAPTLRKQDVPAHPHLVKGPRCDCKALREGRCTIYDTRPKLCREFYCGYMAGVVLERPDKSGIMWQLKWQPGQDAMHIVGLCDSVEKAINTEAVAKQINGLTYWNLLKRKYDLGAIVLHDGDYQFYFDLTSGSGIAACRDVDKTDPEGNRGIEGSTFLVPVPWFVNAIHPATHK